MCCVCSYSQFSSVSSNGIYIGQLLWNMCCYSEGGCVLYISYIVFLLQLGVSMQWVRL